jgi:hypothetical protein
VTSLIATTDSAVAGSAHGLVAILPLPILILILIWFWVWVCFDFDFDFDLIWFCFGCADAKLRWKEMHLQLLFALVVEARRYDREVVCL